ncbi:hypothetical protein LHJ74_14905 [Streptomyces sp. N2-109]|uniref:Uncharacterized protein n=1 Tax=Streptomyces gossypii TaxID=2883101 RepID=A0ABT2JTG5_9ACTN|nr:hypothetical protein [Streptomyces gossypii]MCT2591182.1 hypothetical protein [Streptomyces gossypii]
MLDTGVAAAYGAGTGVAPGLGEPCDLVTVPVRQGLEAVDILRLRAGVGPVLHDGACDTLGFLVPPGTAAGWDVPGSACTSTYGNVHGSGDLSDDAGGDASGGGSSRTPTSGVGWLVPPEGAYTRATEPSRLRAALGQAARTIEAVDRSR